MKVGIHYNARNKRFSPSSKKFIEILKYNNIDIIYLDINEATFWEKVKQCDLFLFKWSHRDYGRQIARTIIPIIETHIGVKCFPSMNCSWLYDDKIREICILQQYNLPIARSWIFYDKRKAIDFVQNTKFPIVFKLKRGAGGSTVRLINNATEAEKCVNLMFKKGVSIKKGFPGSVHEMIKEKGLTGFIRKRAGMIKQRLKKGADYFDDDWGIEKNYVLFQEFLPNNDYDTRVVTIGQRAFAFQRMNKKKDFRASGSQNVVFDPDRIDKRFISLALEISEKLEFDTMSYDFLYGKQGNPVIVEISYTFGGAKRSKIELCHGYWDKQLVWNEGSRAPEYFQLVDLLEMKDLLYC